MAKHHVLIVGTGALATLFAARLSAAGTRVTLLGTWKEALQTIRQHGVRIQHEDGSLEAFPASAIADPAAAAGARFALVLVKAWQTLRAAEQLQLALSADGLALTLQNGYGNRETLAAALGDRRTALGVTTTGATLVAPGIVRPGGAGLTTVEDHPGLPDLIALLRAAGFDVGTTDNPDSLVWSKLVINAAINPLTALLGVPNGALLERPQARALMHDLALEAAAVAAAHGVRLTFADALAAVEDVARRTASNRSSMLQDVQRGAPTEIDAICGAITMEGERLAVATPVNAVVWKLVRALVETPD